jgi:protein-disulfide isomerase
MAMRRLVDVTLYAVVVVLAGSLVYLQARPNSQVRRRWAAYDRQRVAERTLVQEWGYLADSGSRIDTSRQGAAVQVVEFSDYQCGFCRTTATAIDSVLARQEVAISYHHLPIGGNRAAAGAARAAICADRQRTFRAMHRRLMSTTQWQADTNWVREATAAGVPDLAAFAACLGSDETTARLRRDIALARRLQISGTPAFITRSGVHVGARSADAFVRLAAVE